MTDPTPDTSALAAALVKFQAAMPAVHKGKTARVTPKDGGTGYSYSYADLADVAKAAHPVLAEHGLSFTTQPTHHDSLGLVLEGTLLHESGERMRGMLPISGRDPQSLGSAITYARRYLLGCMTGVVTDDDDDAGAAMAAPAPAQARPDPVAAYTAAVQAVNTGDVPGLKAARETITALGMEHYTIPGGAMQGRQLGEVVDQWLAVITPDASEEPEWCPEPDCDRIKGHDGTHATAAHPAAAEERLCSGKRREDGHLCSKPVGHTGPHSYDRKAAQA